MFSRRVALAGLALFVSAPAMAKGAPTLPDVIRRHTEARGGAAALDRVRAIAIDVEITEGGSQINGRYAANVDRLVHIDIIVGGKRVYSEGVDSKGVWLWPGDDLQPKDSVAEGSRNALLHGAETHLIGLHRFAERGHALKLVDREVVEGVNHHVIEVTYSTGHVAYFYLDPVSWMVVRKRDERAYHPDNDLTKKRVESRYADFQPVGGVVAAHRNDDYDLNSGKLLSTSRVLKRVLNPSLPPGVFERTYKPA